MLALLGGLKNHNIGSPGGRETIMFVGVFGAENNIMFLVGGSKTIMLADLDTMVLKLLGMEKT